MDQNEEIFVRFMNDSAFQKEIPTWLASEAYDRLRGGSDGKSTAPAPEEGAHRIVAKAPQRSTAS